MATILGPLPGSSSWASTTSRGTAKEGSWVAKAAGWRDGRSQVEGRPQPGVSSSRPKGEGVAGLAHEEEWALHGLAGCSRDALGRNPECGHLLKCRGSSPTGFGPRVREFHAHGGALSWPSLPHRPWGSQAADSAPHLEAWSHCPPQLCFWFDSAGTWRWPSLPLAAPGCLSWHSPGGWGAAGAGRGGSWVVEAFGNFKEYSSSFPVTQGTLPFLHLKSFEDPPASPHNTSPGRSTWGGVWPEGVG